jgi:2-oxo-4-hydroxy-4-carboxy-5-ureidoimidazoline decarboxylase
MNQVLEHWNRLCPEDAEKEILPCCGSGAWARALANRRPLENEDLLLAASDQIWRALCPSDWLEAFSQHPRIGERSVGPAASRRSAAWSDEEQQTVGTAVESVREALAEANREYERRFGRIFIVCASGKLAPEMLDILRRRLHNDEATELEEAAEEQRKITHLRLKKWLVT